MRPLLRRLALLVPTLIGITFCTFLLMYVAPGDPATVRAGLGRGVSPASIAAFRAEFHLDQPLVPRYLGWLARSARLDFGRSLTDGREVRTRLAEALPATVLLALLAAALSYLLAVPLGCWLAASDGRRAPRLVTAALYGLYALPTAAIGLFALFAGAPYGSGLGVFFTAAGCLSLAMIVKLARYQRGALLAALRADWVRTARAKGAAPARVLFHHALKNALLPMVTLLGTELPALLSGSVIVEEVFGIHGLGLLGFDAVLARDYPLLLGLTTLGAVLTLFGVLFSDLALGLLDPRLKGRST